MSNLVEQWKGLNRRHNEINRWFKKIYGGPDVDEKDFVSQIDSIADVSRILVITLDDIMAQKKWLEELMTNEEFEQTLNQRSLESKSGYGTGEYPRAQAQRIAKDKTED